MKPELRYGFALVVLLLWIPEPGHAEDVYETEARRLLALDGQQLKSYVEKYSAEDADSVLSRIRALKRAEVPEIDRLVILLQHLETVKATKLADKRLQHLLWVFIGMQLLFSGVFLYLIVSQRNLIKSLKPDRRPEKARIFSGK